MGRTFPKFFPYEKFPAIRYTGEMSPVALKSNVGGKKHDWTLKNYYLGLIAQAMQSV